MFLGKLFDAILEVTGLMPDAPKPPPVPDTPPPPPSPVEGRKPTGGRTAEQKGLKRDRMASRHTSRLRSGRRNPLLPDENPLAGGSGYLG